MEPRRNFQKKNVQKSSRSFSSLVVVITGGSRGLGLALAEEFARERARVVLLARDSVELERGKKMLRSRFPRLEVFTYSVDITRGIDTEQVFHKIEEEVGVISVWVNNAGSILVSPYDSLQEEDFRAQMELHLFAVIRLTRLVVDHFRKHAIAGRIVNICSLGGKIAVPHMLSYDASKFALAGFSQGVTSELASEGISVTTVYPTVMRTGSTIQAVFKGDHEKEYNWFTSIDHTPFLSLNAHTAARKIVHAARSRKTELIPSFAAKLRLIVGVVFPELTAYTMKRVAALMPKTQSKTYKTGAQSEELFKESPLYQGLKSVVDGAQKDLNQSRKSDARFNLGLSMKQGA